MRGAENRLSKNPGSELSQAKDSRVAELRRAAWALRFELPDAVWRDFNGRLEAHLADLDEVKSASVSPSGGVSGG